MADKPRRIDEQRNRPDKNWVPLMMAPFFFRRRPASIYEPSFVHGSALADILKNAAKFHPFADPDDPNPIALQMNDGEGRIWVHWVHGDGGRLALIYTTSYFAAQLARPEQIEAEQLAHRAKHQLQNAAEEIADIRQAIERLKYIWSTLQREFDLALNAGAVRLMARVGDPTAPFSEVMHDTFKQYRVEDWHLGNAAVVTGNGPILYSLHVDPLKEPVPERTLDKKLIVAGSVKVEDVPPTETPKPRRRRQEAIETIPITVTDDAPPSEAERKAKAVREAEQAAIKAGLMAGTIGIQEAQERWNSATGRPLVYEPSAADFPAGFEHEIDPMSQPRWTIPMVIAWIADRDLRSVRREMTAWADRTYCLFDDEGRYFWPDSLGGVPDRARGYIVQRLKDGSALRLMHFHPQRERYIAAKQKLWQALDAGSIEARGRLHPSTDRQVIERHRWQDLEVQPTTYFDRSMPLLLREHLREEPMAGLPHMFYDVTLERIEVLRLWEPQAAKAVIAGRRVKGHDRAMLKVHAMEAYRLDLTANPARSRTETADWQFFKDKFGEGFPRQLNIDIRKTLHPKFGKSKGVPQKKPVQIKSGPSG
ncbi:MAG: hypothetical protein ACOZAM_15720 [Pseudomonadota bacterium]